MEKEYVYDANGNLTQDFNKKISKIEYNSLNLPSKLQFSYGHMAEYTYDGAGRKLSVAYTTSKTNLLVPMGNIVAPQATNIAMTLKIDYCGNMIYENGHLSRILTDVGYITLNGTTPMYHYYLKDHLGNNRVVMNERGAVEQVNHYYTFGGLMGESTGGEAQPYKYNGKELDHMLGLDWYDYGARHYDAALSKWTTMDPLAEKYYDISPYAYCGNNPINYFDPDGRDWYKDKDGTYQYSPNVHAQSDLQKGQQYLWRFHQFKTINYRSDGSIMYSNETTAYNRMWNQADKHYRTSVHKGGREIGAFILEKGGVLVLPDYLNVAGRSEIGKYGYKINSKGYLSKGNERFKITAQIHTHQDKSLNALPLGVIGKNSAILDGDLSVSFNLGGLPVITISYDNKVRGIYSADNGNQFGIVEFGNRLQLLQGSITLSTWLRNYPTAK